ncbi:Kcnh6 [Symbiodinium sp. CCMP2456]|nr:Kcnh6 [Symbiodinium sp. CCMP2456]
MMATCFIIWDTATIPLEMFPVDQVFGQVITVVAVISSVFWIVDVPLHFLFGVQTGGAIELRPLQLAKLYMRSWLLADILIIVIDVTLLSFQALASDVNPVFRSGRFLRTLRLIRLVRLLRVGKLERQVMKIANRFLSTYSLMALRVAGYLAVMLAMNHLIACCWYGVGAWTQHLGNWLERSAIDPDSVSAAYVASLHWSLTQFTPSTNPIAPGNAWERFYAIWVILLAMACFSSFIGSIGTTLTSMRSVRREQLLQETKLEVFFTERNLSLDLFERVKGALQQDKMARTRLHEQEVVLIQGIPERIKVQLHKEMFLRILFQLEIWPTWARNDMDFLQHLCHHTMSEHTSRPGQDIFMPHTECFLVYVLETGSLEYFVQGRQPVHCTETSNAVLCLPSLWAEWHHAGHLTATFGTCFYVGIDCQQFCTLAASFGGPLCEYLKVLGILLLGQIEAAQGMNLVITDISVATDINIRELSERAEGFTSLREHLLNHSDSQVRSETRESFESMSEDAVETRVLAQELCASFAAALENQGPHGPGMCADQELDRTKGKELHVVSSLEALQAAQADRGLDCGLECEGAVGKKVYVDQTFYQKLLVYYPENPPPIGPELLLAGSAFQELWCPAEVYHDFWYFGLLFLSMCQLVLIPFLILPQIVRLRLHAEMQREVDAGRCQIYPMALAGATWEHFANTEFKDHRTQAWQTFPGMECLSSVISLVGVALGLASSGGLVRYCWISVPVVFLIGMAIRLLHQIHAGVIFRKRLLLGRAELFVCAAPEANMVSIVCDGRVFFYKNIGDIPRVPPESLVWYSYETMALARTQLIARRHTETEDEESTPSWYLNIIYGSCFNKARTNMWHTGSKLFPVDNACVHDFQNWLAEVERRQLFRCEGATARPESFMQPSDVTLLTPFHVPAGDMRTPLSTNTMMLTAEVEKVDGLYKVTMISMSGEEAASFKFTEGDTLADLQHRVASRPAFRDYQVKIVLSDGTQLGNMDPRMALPAFFEKARAR